VEKQTINIVAIKPVAIEYREQTIKVIPYLDLKSKVELMKSYVEEFFSNTNITSTYMIAQYSLILGIVDYQTDIDITNLDVDDIINSGLWDQIKYHILNYDEFKNEIGEVVKFMRENIVVENSVGNVLSNLSMNLTNFLTKISEIDLSKEGVTKILEALNEQKNEYNKIVDPSKVVEIPKTRKKKELLQ